CCYLPVALTSAGYAGTVQLLAQSSTDPSQKAGLRNMMRMAEPKVRIHSPPAKSLLTFGSAAWERSRTPTRLLHRPPLRARSTLRSPTRPDRRDRLPEACGRTSANLSASWWPKDQFELIEVLEEEREDLRLSDFRKSRSRFLPPCHAPDAGGAAEGRLSPAAKAVRYGGDRRAALKRRNPGGET